MDEEIKFKLFYFLQDAVQCSQFAIARKNLTFRKFMSQIIKECDSEEGTVSELFFLPILYVNLEGNHVSVNSNDKDFEQFLNFVLQSKEYGHECIHLIIPKVTNEKNMLNGTSNSSKTDIPNDKDNEENKLNFKDLNPVFNKKVHCDSVSQIEEVVQDSSASVFLQEPLLSTSFSGPFKRQETSPECGVLNIKRVTENDAVRLLKNGTQILIPDGDDSFMSVNFSKDNWYAAYRFFLWQNCNQRNLTPEYQCQEMKIPVVIENNTILRISNETKKVLETLTSVSGSNVTEPTTKDESDEELSTSQDSTCSLFEKVDHENCEETTPIWFRNYRTKFESDITGLKQMIDQLQTHLNKQEVENNVSASKEEMNLPQILKKIENDVSLLTGAVNAQIRDTDEQEFETESIRLSDDPPKRKKKFKIHQRKLMESTKAALAETRKKLKESIIKQQTLLIGQDEEKLKESVKKMQTLRIDQETNGDSARVIEGETAGTSSNTEGNTSEKTTREHFSILKDCNYRVIKKDEPLLLLESKLETQQKSHSTENKSSEIMDLDDCIIPDECDNSDSSVSVILDTSCKSENLHKVRDDPDVIDMPRCFIPYPVGMTFSTSEDLTGSVSVRVKRKMSKARKHGLPRVKMSGSASSSSISSASSTSQTRSGKEENDIVDSSNGTSCSSSSSSSQPKSRDNKTTKAKRSNETYPNDRNNDPTKNQKQPVNIIPDKIFEMTNTVFKNVYNSVKPRSDEVNKNFQKVFEESMSAASRFIPNPLFTETSPSAEELKISPTNTDAENENSPSTSANENTTNLSAKKEEDYYSTFNALPDKIKVQLLQLNEMGFDNNFHNLFLLKQYPNDVEKVIEALVNFTG